MVKYEKGEIIWLMASLGFCAMQIAWAVYRDRSEKGQRKVRAMLSYMKKKALHTESGSAQYAHDSLRDIAFLMRKQKNVSASILWMKGWSTRAIAIMLYGDDSERSKNRVWAHISKFRKKKLRSGCGFPEQDLRSMVAVGNSTNKTCEFFSQPQPQNLNLKSETATIRFETETFCITTETETETARIETETGTDGNDEHNFISNTPRCIRHGQ